MFHLKQIFLAFTRREKVSFFAASGAAILSGFILVILGFLQFTEAVPASGGEYSEGFVGQPSFINPVLAASEVDKGLVRLVFSNIRDITEKIEPAEDGRIWKIRLKEKLVWHDNEKLTSDDVVFTIQKIQDPESSSPLATVWQGIAAQRLSELELQLSLINPYAFFPEILNSLYILPRHIFGNIPPANWRLSDFNLRPVGSGPYRFSSFEKRTDGFVAAYRLNSWKDSGGEVLINNMIFRFFADSDKLIQSFNAGQIDAFSGIEPGNISLISRPYETVPFRLPNYYAVFFNQSKNIALKEAEVREALGIALDKNAIVRNALLGRGAVSFGPIPEEISYFADELKGSTTSLELAAQILEEAGWKLNEDGFREATVQRTAIPLEFALTVPRIGFLASTAEILAEEWKKIGVKVNLEIADTNDIVTNAIRNRGYEALLFGNILSRSFDLFSFWHSSERFHPGLNVALYNSKEADVLIEAIRQNLDEESRREQFRELQLLIDGDHPAIFLYSPHYLYIASRNVRGVLPKLISEPAERFVGAKDWYLRTARVLR